MDILSLEEELALSDKLVERYRVRDKNCKKQGTTRSRLDLSLLSRKDKKIWEEGDEASRILVFHYLPAIEAIARKVAGNYGISAHTNPSIDDLVQEGVIAAFSCTWAFNLRGGDGRMGRRFKSYAAMHIKKSMRRAVMKHKTLFKVDIDTIQTSWAWKATTETLRDTLGRNPTDKEIQEAMYFKSSGTNENFLPMRGSFIDVDDYLTGGSNLCPTESQVMNIAKDEKVYNNIFIGALNHVIGPDVAHDAYYHFGLDRGHMRDDVECAEMWDVSRVAARRRIDVVHVALAHPHFRVKMKEYVEYHMRMRNLPLIQED